MHVSSKVSQSHKFVSLSLFNVNINMSVTYLAVIVCNNIQNPTLIMVHILITVYADVH